VAVVGTEEAMGRGSTGISRRPIHVEVCPPILPGDFDDEADPIGAMTDVWWSRIDAVLAPRYGFG
jgi:hypothetical protein